MTIFTDGKMHGCVSKSHEICIGNEELCIKNEEFWIKSSKIDAFCRLRMPPLRGSSMQSTANYNKNANFLRNFLLEMQR